MKFLAIEPFDLPLIRLIGVVYTDYAIAYRKGSAVSIFSLINDTSKALRSGISLLYRAYRTNTYIKQNALKDLDGRNDIQDS